MLTRTEKKNLTIFMSVTLSLTIIMSLFIPKCYEINGDAVLFTWIQAYFPMTGVMIVLLYNMRQIKFRLKGFCIVFLFVSGISMCSGVATLFLDYNICIAIEGTACRIGSLLSLLLIFYLSDSTDKIRISIKKSTVKEWIGYTFLLFILMLASISLDSMLRVMLGIDKQNYLTPIFTSGENIIKIVITLLMNPINFATCFITFLGEEFGWRRFLQPLLEKRYGMRLGILILGIIWGIWHLPLSIYVYSEENWGIQFLNQIILCILFAIFLAYVYLKTKNIWIVTWLHYFWNTFFSILPEFVTEDSESIEKMMVSTVVYLLCFLPFLKSKIFNDSAILDDMFL